MKKVILTALFILMCGPAFAAGTIAVSEDYPIGDYHTTKVVRIAFVADAADGSIPDLTLGATVIGWNIYQVIIKGNLGGIEPTEDSDVYIYQEGVDMLDGNGVDQLDNTANRTAHCAIDGTAATPAIITDITVTVTQAVAATNSAAGQIILVLYK